MKPTLAIVGRPNVGKSTLFNRLTRTRDALVADVPGLTRDRHYGMGRLGGRPYLVVDTGGLEPEASGVFVEMAKQARTPIAQAHGIVLVTDARQGLTAQDRAIDVELVVKGRRYVLVDTAGLRRRGKVFESVEKFSVIKTLQAIDRANVAVLVLDAQGEISDQDAHIAGFILERGRAVVVAVNKWDDVDRYARDMTKRAIARKLKCLSFARCHYVSAREGRGLAKLMDSVDAAYRAAMAKLPTPRLTPALIAAVAKQAPARAGLSRPKLRYAHQGGSNPPIVVVHGTALSAVSESYRRYLEADFRRVFRLEGTPLRIEFRSGRNPYVDRRI